MSLTEIIFLIAAILVLIDIFFASDIPTHIAYILVTINIIKEFDIPWLYKILMGLIIWFGLILFHYFLWRKVLEKINDRFIAPSIHKGGIEGLVGETGVIKNIEGKNYLSVNDELYNFKTQDNKDIIVGKEYKIIKVDSDTLFI